MASTALRQMEPLLKNVDIMSLCLRSLVVEERLDLSKQARKRVRRENRRLFGMLQGKGISNQLFTIPLSEIAKDYQDGRFAPRNVPNATFAGPTYALSIRLGNGETTPPERVYAKQLRIHPLTEAPISLDFIRAPESEPLKMEIPLAPVNSDKCDILKVGFLLHLTKAIRIEVSPFARPPECAWVDLTGRRAGSIRAGDIFLPEGVELLENPKRTILKLATKA